MTEGEAAARAAEPQRLLDGARAGRPAALGRLLTIVETGGAAAHEVARAAFQLGGRAYTVGITGAPGAGKSTLTGRLVGLLRARGARVAVLAVDPSSPFSGGALLGDRVRMLEHSLDDGVFIRSMATRGALGGLALAAPQAARVLDAAGFDWVLLETVGVGQAELDVAGVADTTLVVVTPGWGDDVQAAKAGLLEIADVFVVNKADRDGAQDSAADLRLMLRTRSRAGGEWRPTVLQTSAHDGGGVDAVLAAVDAHRADAVATGSLDANRAGRLWREVESLVALRAAERARQLLAEHAAELRERVVARELDPWDAASLVLGD